MVKEVSATVEGSIRRTSRILGQRRESLYYKCRRVNEDKLIQSELKRLSGLHINWGFGLMSRKMRLEGRIWSKKRVYRNYKALNLNLRSPQKRKKIKRDNRTGDPAQHHCG